MGHSVRYSVEAHADSCSLCQANIPALSSRALRSRMYYLRLTVVLQHGQTGLAQPTPVFFLALFINPPAHILHL